MSDAAALGLFPEPQSLRVTESGTSRWRPSGYHSSSPDGAILAEWRRREGLAAGGDAAAMELRLLRRSDESTRYIDETRRLSDEKYLLSVRKVAGRLLGEITYAEERGLRHALATVAALHRGGGFVPCEIEDYPSFAVRGVIEGFYGAPWSDEQRLDMMRLLARWRMNTFVYGPKDDPYHRERWALRYDARSLERLSALCRGAEEAGLDFWYSVGPGLSLRYSSEEDFERLLGKLLSVYELGVRSFALLLDDIPPFLQFPEDRGQFPELIAAQIRLASRLHDSLLHHDPAIHLAICPTEYHGRGDEYTVSRLGRSLHPAIDLFWTGPEICSRELTTRDAALFAESTLHRPLYWDNYPVNDLEMANEMHIGPYRNRDRDLWRFSRGIIANAMEHSEASKIPIITIACYAWNPRDYDPERCHLEAIRQVAGERDAENFAVFADNLRSSCLSEVESPRLAEALERFRFELHYGEKGRAFEAIERSLAPFLAAARSLSEGMENDKLARELARWIRKYSEGLRLLETTLSCLRGNLRLEELREGYLRYMKDPARVFADVLYRAVEQVAGSGLAAGNG